MKLKTIKRFIDNKENVVREKGDVFNVDKSRFEEIKKAGRFVELIAEDKVEVEKKEEKKTFVKNNK